jgi:hypothetical protein
MCIVHQCTAVSVTMVTMVTVHVVSYKLQKVYCHLILTYIYMGVRYMHAVALLPPTAVRMNRERASARPASLYLVTSSHETRPNIWHILNITS